MDAPAEAIAALATFADRSRRKTSVNFPLEYVKRADGQQPMAARLLASNDVRLKLHMTLVMRATRAPHTFQRFTTSTLSRVLNLSPDNGLRRITSAMKWLRNQKLVADAPLPDGKTGLALLHPDESGSPWDLKGAKRWVGVPFSLWTNAWILQLNGRSIAVLLALLELNGGSSHPDGELMSGHRKQQYGLSDDTWTRATKELVHLGLLKTTTVKWGSEEHENRTRKRYLPLLDRLNEPPDWSRS